MPPKPQRVRSYAQAPNPSNDSDGDLFDYTWIREALAFVLRSAGRHRRLAVAVFLSTVALGGVALWALPKTYHVETRILAQRNPMVSVLANPTFGRPTEADAPTRAARETVLRWDNLVTLARETGLADVPTDRRAPVLRLRDWLMTDVFQVKPTQEERIEGVAFALEKRLQVNVNDGVVVISVDWNDPNYAFRVVEVALQNFMEARHATEISIVGEAISILQSHLTTLDHDIAELESQLARSRGTRLVRPQRTQPADANARTASTDQEVSRLKAVLASKHRAISDLESFRHRRLEELQALLAQHRSVYADMHPSVVGTRQSIQSLEAPSPQIEALTLEAQDLERELTRLGATNRELRSLATVDASRSDLAERVGAGDPTSQQEADLRGDLRVRYSKRATLADRIDSARMEMDTAQAAFKYRYVVIGPPQVPKRPVRPNPLLVVLGSVLGGALLALFTAVAIDIRSGRVVEKWQVERHLALPVLGELRE